MDIGRGKAAVEGLEKIAAAFVATVVVVVAGFGFVVATGSVVLVLEQSELPELPELLEALEIPQLKVAALHSTRTDMKLAIFSNIV